MKKLSIISLFLILFTSCKDDLTDNQKVFLGEYKFKVFYYKAVDVCRSNQYFLDDSFEMNYIISKNGENGLKIPYINRVNTEYVYIDDIILDPNTQYPFVWINTSNYYSFGISKRNDSLIIGAEIGHTCTRAHGYYTCIGRKIN